MVPLNNTEFLSIAARLNLNENTTILFDENAFENIVCHKNFDSNPQRVNLWEDMNTLEKVVWLRTEDTPVIIEKVLPHNKSSSNFSENLRSSEVSTEHRFCDISHSLFIIYN